MPDVVSAFTRTATSRTRVSVVIPAYNAESTIADTLESLLRQTHQAWEALVVDDGSNDGTPAVVGSFAARDARVRLIRARHGGEGAARNEGLARASGDWVLFLDADDWIEPNHLQCMLAAAADDSSLDAVHCGYARVARDGTHVVERYEAPTGDLFATLAYRAVFPVHACIVRRAALQEVGGFDPTLRTSTDWDLWQRVARTGARFGAVRETLALYRMQPQSASLNATQLFDDGLEVLRRGHREDSRVARPLPAHAEGQPPALIHTQVYYLLAWCAGLLIGAGRDPSPLFARVRDVVYSDLNGEAIAQCLFESALLPACEPPAHWVEAWPRLEKDITLFLVALETQSRTIGLAARTSTALGRLILERSIATGDRQAFLECERRHWRDLVDAQVGEAVRRHDEARQALEHDREQLRAIIDKMQVELAGRTRDREQLLTELAAQARAHEAARQEHEQARADLAERAREHEQARSALEQERGSLNASIDRLEARARELDGENRAQAASYHRLVHSLEHRFGSLVVNDLRLRGVVERAESARAAAEHRAERWRLERAGRRSTGRPRVLTSICADFPIYSQSFAHQELSALAEGGFDVRLVYSRLNARDGLSASSAGLWNLKHRLRLHRPTHGADYAWYRTRMPDRVKALTARLCDASGMTEQDLEQHHNFLQAFSFTRQAEAYRAQYLHTYFFYDRSLMALVAAWLLGIPRGVSCYADHLMQDYELKVVPLHLELCDIVIATSARIKRELVGLAPHVNPDRILVKPNAIDAARFTPRDRDEPAEGQPFRLVCTSRIDPKKGLLDLVEAVHLLRARGRNVEAHLVGAADATEACLAYKRRLDTLITERNLWGKVHLEGRHDDAGVRRFLDIAHVFVAPFVETETGDKDGIPTSLLEAMASGLPAVATDAGSITEVITAADEGAIVPQRDPAALAAAIDALLDNRERRVALGRRGAAVVRERFDIRVCEGPFHRKIRAVTTSRTDFTS